MSGRPFWLSASLASPGSCCDCVLWGVGYSSWYSSLASFSCDGGDSGAKSSSSSSSLSSRSSLAVHGFELDEIDDGVWSLTWLSGFVDGLAGTCSVFDVGCVIE